MPIRINGEEIPESAIQYEFDRLVKFYSEHMPPSEILEQIKVIRKRAVDQAVGAKLLMAEAERLDLSVPSGHVDEKFEEMAGAAGGKEQFAELLRKQQLTPDMVRESIRKGSRVDMLVAKITEGVSDPSEQEMEAHFEEHEQEYVKPDRAQAQHILIKADAGDAAAREQARSKLEGIRAEIEGGADFRAMASEHSDCPSGKNSSGSLGWFSRGMMVPEFDEAVFSMEANKLSRIVETSLGLHLIYKTAEESGGPAAYTDVRDKIRDFLRHVRRGEVLSANVNELRKKAVIEGL